MVIGEPMMLGRAIAEGHFPGMMSPDFTLEILYSFIIILSSLMIYFSTKELYELSSHKGIKYFRLAFLFFSISYFIRAFVKLAIIYVLPFGVHPRTINHASLGFFMYFSIMSIFFLLTSVMYRRWKDHKSKVRLFHLIALVVAISTPFFRNKFYPVLINLILLCIILFTVSIAYKDSKNKKRGFNLLFIYFLLSIFWALNLIDILVPNFLSTIQLWIYLASLSIFMTILYKVLTKVGGK